MEKKLAIKGHSTRGEEVIKLLEMMGGKNKDNMFCGKDSSSIYFIDGYEFIRKVIIENNIHTMRHWQIFTLEEFLEKYPFEVGDIVKFDDSLNTGTITNMNWHNEDIIYHVQSNHVKEWKQTFSVNILNKYNRLESNGIEHIWATTVETNKRNREDVLFDSIIWHLRNSVNNGKQYLTGGECETYFRELVKNVKENDMESCKCPEHEDIKKVAYLSINDNDYANEIEVNLGDDYEYKFEMNRLYILKKKPKYPKTYKECCDVLNLSWNKCFVMFDIDHNGLTDEENNLCESLIKLKRCRDAYWKIASEQMGLDKPWDSKYGYGEWGYWIGYDINANKIYYQDSRILLNHLLVFPSEEMRDAFCENFKDLIEKCKELL